LFIFLFILINVLKIQSQIPPQLGAEIYLEPGQTPQQVDHWVKVLSESNMSVARVFMMWNYMEPEPGVWDFALYDALFESAEKHGIKITATLVPNSPPFHWGKIFFYRTHDMRMYEKEEYRKMSEFYIQKIVERYKNSPALDSWWLYNEPSGNPHPDTFAVDEFKKWLKEKYVTIDSMNDSWHSFYPSFQEISYDEGWLGGMWGWPVVFYDWRNFWHAHVNNQIIWLGEEVRKYDPDHPFYTNPPGLWNALTHYDVPGMKNTVQSLGSSLHPSWSFAAIPRYKFGLVVSYENGLLHGITGKTPYWISELQAGNNSLGVNPMGPTPLDLAQWTWTSIGSGAERVIYWLLNSRMQGSESNEWALLNFQQQPSDRLKKVSEIAEVIKLNQNEFTIAKPVTSPVTIIISPLTLLMQDRKQNRFTTLDALKALAHQKASMACYNALMQQGIPVQIKLIKEFNWAMQDKNQVAILADAMCLTMKDIEGIEMFVRNGNKVIVTGLTGLYDENEKSWVVNRDFPLADVFGGSVLELFMEPGNFNIRLDEYKIDFPSQVWYTQILPGTGKVVGKYNGKQIAVRNEFGKGSVLWIPTMVDIGAWVDTSVPLASLLKDEIGDAISDLPFRFKSFHENCYMHTLLTSDGYITVIVNGNNNMEKIEIIPAGSGNAKIIYGKGWDNAKHTLTIEGGETVVINWK